MHFVRAPFAQLVAEKRSGAGQVGPKTQSMVGRESAATTPKNPLQIPLLLRSSTQLRWQAPEVLVTAWQPDVLRVHVPVLHVTVPVWPVGHAPTPNVPSHSSPVSSFPLPQFGTHPAVFFVQVDVHTTVPVVPVGQVPTPNGPSHASPESSAPLPHVLAWQPDVLRVHVPVLHVTVPV
jgi:hypothetical protein